MIQGYTLATFPNVAQYIYAQPEKQAKELCTEIMSRGCIRDADKCLLELYTKTALEDEDKITRELTI